MNDDPRVILDDGRWLSLLESVTAAESLDAAATEVARQFASMARAHAAGVFVVLYGRVFVEFCHPEVVDLSHDLYAHFRRLAVEVAAGAPPSADLLPGPPGEIITRGYVLPMKNRLTGVLCLAYHPAGGSPEGRLGKPFERVLRLVASRLAALQEIEAERTKRGQYEHWFRTTDRQIRTLEGERQKFAALVNSTDTYVFVADRTGIIRWTSRSLLDHVPAGTGADSWLGRPCRELCRSLAGGATLACGDCALMRAAASGKEVIHRPTGDPGGTNPLRLTAQPIKDLQGRAQEVMVVLEGLSRIYPRAA